MNTFKLVKPLLCLLVGLSSPAQGQNLNPTTGLVEDSGHNLVAAHCSACHSTKLISQNRMSRETWLSTIRWMQKTQNLWPLGDAEKPILDYLEKHYAPKALGRRAPLPAHLLPPKQQ